MSNIKIRPHTQSVIEKLKSSSLINIPKPTVSNTDSTLLFVPVSQIRINPNNVRKTFTSLESLAEFTIRINWPKNALNGNLEDPLRWIESLDMVNDEDKFAFQKIVQRALSIQSIGQLQPVGAIRSGDQYDIVYGSTRAMACYLLNQDIAITILDKFDSLSALKAHLFENLERDNLSFTETVTGYLRLFEMLLESKEIERISRSSVMKTLNLSRTQSLVWSKILSVATTEEAFKALLLNGEFAGYRDAIAHIDSTYKRQQEIAPPVLNCPEISSDVETGKRNTHDNIDAVITSPETKDAIHSSSDLPVESTFSPIELTATDAYIGSMIEIVSAAFHHIANDVNHPASHHIKVHISQCFPISGLAQAQTSINWLAKIIALPIQKST